MRKLFPVVLILLGLGIGAGAGFFLRPAPPLEEANAEKPAEDAPIEIDPEKVPEFVKLTNQFVIPVVEDDRIASLVILSLTLEVAPGTSEGVYAQEPKLRDAVLQLLFDHANTGGFRGSFTDADNLVILRRGLLEGVQSILGDTVSNVLITDIVRQDS